MSRKMSRPMCHRCNRPMSVCICDFIQNVVNQVSVIILQHPTEAKRHYGTLPVVKNCLSRCQVFVGEDFSREWSLRRCLDRFEGESFLVFPGDNAIPLSAMSKKYPGEEPDGKVQLVFIDGTWKKAKKIHYMNPFLQQLPAVFIDGSPVSAYRTRKSSLAYSLSLAEACYYSLKVFDPTVCYEPLLESFNTVISYHAREKSGQLNTSHQIKPDAQG